MTVRDALVCFCRNCGVLIEREVGVQEKPKCTNCNAPVALPEQRIEGVFTMQDYNTLYNPPNEEF